MGSFLLALGVVVGVAASVGLILGFEPARLPRALLNIAAYKLAFVAAAGLLTAGAVLTRYSRRTEDRDIEAHTRAQERGEAPEGLVGEGQPVAEPMVDRREAERLFEDR